MSGAEPCTGSQVDRELCSRLYETPGGPPLAPRHADAAGNGSGDVGEDVTEEVVGHDHVVPLRVADHEHAGRVDVLVFGGDLGELGGDGGERARPEAAGLGQD